MAELEENNGHRSQRAKLRHATFIHPHTGLRSNSTFTLRSPDAQDESSPVQTIHHVYSPFSSDLPHSIYPSNQQSSGRQLWTEIRSRTGKCKDFIVSDLGKAVFKCALAYTLGSMCTFVPALSELFGRQDSKHTIATITVYFHPARSQGSMFEALIFASTAFIYTAAVSVTSMGVSVLFTDYLHQVVIGHIIVLIVFVGGGLGMVGWVKLKKSSPLVNISCSLTSLALISVLTAEGAVQAGDLSFRKIGQYLRMIVAGVIATMLVSFLVFPISGRQRFKKNMVDVTDALSDMLGLITAGFISGDEAEFAEDHEFYIVREKHRKLAASLNQNLREAKYELNVAGYEQEARIQAKLVQCVSQIAQSIGGLRSAAGMQFVITQQVSAASESVSAGLLLDQATPNGSINTSPSGSPFLHRRATFDHTMTSGLNSAIGSLQIPGRTWPKFRSQGQIFDLFIDRLGPSMRSLAFTMKEILDELPYNPEANYAVENNPKLRFSLENALALYKEARKDALQKVYNRRDMERDRPIEVAADWEEAAACCGQFSFCLLEVAEQLKEYLVTLDDLEAQIESWERSWHWLKWWKPSTQTAASSPDHPLDNNHEDSTHGLRIRAPKPKDIPYDGSWGAESWPKYKQKIFKKLHKTLSFLRRDDKKFAVKVGFGAMLYALPSYIAATRPIYQHWRGEWGLLSYMLVCSMTIGASNTTGYQRFLGTCLGASLAVVAWLIGNESAVIMAIFGFCMAYWTAYIIVGQGKGPMGRFIMLTYNLSALYAYALVMADDPNDGDEEDGSNTPLIWTIAGHRVVAVLTGCIWGLIITRVVWPISARTKLKDGLSLLWLRMGLIWKRDPLSIFLDDDIHNNITNLQPHYMNLREEISLHAFLSHLSTLIDASTHEFSLRRPFPSTSYRRILQATSRMLDAFHTMNTVIQKDLQASDGEAALLRATSKERAQLCSRISHQFSVLASSMKLEYSMATDALPRLENARDRLLAKTWAFRKEDAGDGDDNDGAKQRTSSDEDYSLLYTYALVTGLLGIEVQECLREVEGLFGVLDEETLWLQ